MKSLLKTSILCLATVAALVQTPHAFAQTLYWGGSANDTSIGGSGTWDPSIAQWGAAYPGAANTVWTNGYNAVFSGSTNGTVDIGDIIDAGDVTFSATAGVYTISNQGQLTVSGVLSNAAPTNLQTIDNLGGLLYLVGSSSTSPGTGGISLLNGGVFDIADSSTPVITLTSLSNTSGSFSGLVAVGKNELVLTNGLSLSSVPTGELNFVLTDANTLDYGKITVSGGTFSDPGTSLTKINFGPGGGDVAAGIYDLINFTGASTSGLTADPYDTFFLGSLPQNVAVATLQYGGPGNKILQLVAVPEPSSLMMPMAAVLGLVWLGRRTARMSA